MSGFIWEGIKSGIVEQCYYAVLNCWRMLITLYFSVGEVKTL